MKKIVIVSAIFIVSLLDVYGQETRIEFEDYNTTTYVLLNLMESSAKKGLHQEVSVYYNTLRQLRSQYVMKQKHKDRMDRFREKNLQLSIPFMIDLSGVSPLSNDFVNYERDPLLKEFSAFLALKKENTDIETLALLKTIQEKPNSKLGDFKLEDQLKLQEIEKQITQLRTGGN